MAVIFTNKTLIVNNKDKDKLELERELTRALENKIMLLYFGSGECLRCQEFAPILKEFFVRLTDEFYVERASQLVLVFVSLDETEEKQDKFLKTMPKRWLFLPFQDEFRR
nr:nucleoredoxin-like protein 1 [Zootoca vivipara]